MGDTKSIKKLLYLSETFGMPVLNQLKPDGFNNTALEIAISRKNIFLIHSIVKCLIKYPPEIGACFRLN